MAAFTLLGNLAVANAEAGQHFCALHVAHLSCPPFDRASGSFSSIATPKAGSLTGCLQANVVASYGNASYCGIGLNASLAVCSVPIGTGSGPVNVTLPLATAVQVTATPSAITM